MSSTIEYPHAKERPGAAARHVIAAEINDEQNWTSLDAAGLEDLETTTGPFAMITPTGFWRDKGALARARFMGKAISRQADLGKLAWLMPRMLRAMPYLGYVVVGGARM
jgi:hypothetical protein